MKAGETAVVKCPSHLETIGHNMEYEIKVKECGLHPESFDKAKQKQLATKKLIIKSTLNSDLVLEVKKTDKYAPKKTGLHQVFINNRKDGELAQQWKYNKDTKALQSVLFPQLVLLDGGNNNLVAYTNSGLEQQKFKYNFETQQWTNTCSQSTLEVSGTVKAGAFVGTN